MKNICCLFLRFFTLFIFSTLLIALTSCQAEDTSSISNSDITTSVESAQNVDLTPEIEEIINPDRSLFIGQTLTIACRLVARFDDLIRKYMSENPGVRIEVIDYWDDDMRCIDLTTSRQVIATQLMAGSAPLLINSLLVDSLHPGTTAYFFDWFPIMYTDPDFNEDDWFMNVFHAASVDGKLYSFPLSFFCFRISVNNTVPGLLAEWEWRESITIPEVLALHRDFPTESAYFVYSGFEPTWAAWFNIGDFVDINTDRVNFNEEFIDFITYMRDATNPQGINIGHGIIPPEVEAHRSETYLFELYLSRVLICFLDDEELFMFSDPKPIVNNYGELIIFLEDSFLLNANASTIEKALAWDFIKFISNPENHSSMPVFWNPTNRALLRHHVQILLPSNIIFADLQINKETSEAVEHVANQIATLGEMPMRRYSELPGVLGNKRDGLIIETLRQFRDGLLSADDVARNLQNMVELMLMEIGVR